MKTYADLYSWRNWRECKAGSVLQHSNGAVSAAIEWNGISIELQNKKVQSDTLNAMRDHFESLPLNHHLTIENHFERDYSDTTADEYIEYGNKHIVRDVNGFGKRMREELANHIRYISMKNRIITIVTLTPKSSFSLFRAKSNINKIDTLSEECLSIASQLASKFNGGKVLSYEEFDCFIWSIYHREKKSNDTIPPINTRFKINERVATKPVYDDGILRLGNYYHKVISLLDYPDASPDWFYNIASSVGLEIHVSQILKRVDESAIMHSSSKDEKRHSDASFRIGGEEAQLSIDDNAKFRMLVKSNKLKLFNNAYIIKLMWPDQRELIERAAEFEKLINNTVTMGDSKEISFAFWRYSQPAQGHHSRFSRVDHSVEVAHMAPILNFHAGDTVNRQMLRLTADAKAITLAYETDKPGHAFGIGKTGGGKGVAMISEICETFPLGINFYGIEYGETYRWVTEAFDGDYLNLSEESVISPFPEYSAADASNEESPLPASLVEASTESILPIVAKSQPEHRHFIKTVSEKVLKQLYLKSNHSSNSAPTFQDFFECADQALKNKVFEGSLETACEMLCENLYAFLEGVAGQNFKYADNVNFSSGITFANFKGIHNEELRKLLLMFLALRYKQIAFMDATPTRIIIDELHEFNAIDPELMKLLLRQITRMGRKEASSFHGVTQELFDMEVDFVKQMSHRLFLYMESHHQETSSMFKMNDGVLKRWEDFDDPTSVDIKMNYRQGIRYWGKRPWDLHLTFPQIFLDIADSNPTSLELKEKINSMYPNGGQNAFDRLAMFRNEIGRFKSKVSYAA